MTRPDGSASSGVHLAEVVAAIALAADLGLGQPLEHMLRSCVLATRLAELVRASEEEREATYWVTLFTTAGCTGTSWELSHFFGDDIAFRQGVYDVGPAQRDWLRYGLTRAVSDSTVVEAGRRVLALLSGMGRLEQSFVAHCAVNGQLAERLGLGPLVVSSLLQTFARWDGKGLPKGVQGDELLLPIRIANLANQVEVAARENGPASSVEVARRFAGNAYDPALVEVWCRHADELLTGLDDESSWDAVIKAGPGRVPLTEAELDDALELFADYADLKSPWFSGHSRGVAARAAAAARELGLPAADVTTVRRAGLVHDIGRNGVPNTVWDKPGALTDSEREKVRLHAYYTDRVLHRAGKLAGLAAIASAAHEQPGGGGYPRGARGSAVPLLGRLLEAADCYQAMSEDRPHRSALTAQTAAAELRRMAYQAELDGPAADAVLAAAGHPVRRTPTAPAGLTPREVEVLVLASRGLTTKAIGSRLGIAPKTAGNHLERAYAKAGVGSRAEAAMFAMQHGLLGAWA